MKDAAGNLRGEVVELVPTDKLFPHPDNPRRVKDDIADAELRESIACCGVIQPVTITPCNGTDGFTILSGHRRVEASIELGLPVVPCLIFSGSIVDAVLVASNTGALPIGMSELLFHLCERVAQSGASADDVARACGVGPGLANRVLSMASWSDELINAVFVGSVSWGVANQLSFCASDEDCLRLLDCAAQGGCTVAQARKWRREANRARGEDETISDALSEGAMPRQGALVTQHCQVCGVRPERGGLVFLRLCSDCSAVAVKAVIKST